MTDERVRQFFRKIAFSQMLSIVLNIAFNYHLNKQKDKFFSESFLQDKMRRWGFRHVELLDENTWKHFLLIQKQY